MLYIEEVNKILDEKYKDSDCVESVIQGSCSTVYHVDNKYTVKVCKENYKEEKEALERLKGKEFVPEIYGFNDSLKIIVMEKLNGEFFKDYIYIHDELPPNFISSWYDMRITMLETLCYDYDEKLSELCWIDGQMKKVDYGQTDCYSDQESIIQLCDRRIRSLKEKKLKLLENDDEEWNKLTDELIRKSVPISLIENYRKSL